MPESGQPMRLQTFPSNDAAFRDAVVATFQSAGTRLPEELEQALLPTYPRVRVAARARAAGGPDDSGLVWYVFRDGAVLSGEAPGR